MFKETSKTPKSPHRMQLDQCAGTRLWNRQFFHISISGVVELYPTPGHDIISLSRQGWYQTVEAREVNHKRTMDISFPQVNTTGSQAPLLQLSNLLPKSKGLAFGFFCNQITEKKGVSFSKDRSHSQFAAAKFERRSTLIQPIVYRPASKEITSVRASFYSKTKWEWNSWLDFKQHMLTLNFWYIGESSKTGKKDKTIREHQIC